MTWFLYVVYEALAGAFFYSMLCRGVKTSIETTRTDVLVGLWVQAIASVASIAAPIVTGWDPTWQGVALMLIVVTLQWVNAKHWRDGVPLHLRRPEHAHRV